MLKRIKDALFGKKKTTIRIGGRELREGQSLSPEEAEELIRTILAETPGPVTIRTEDASTGASLSAEVNEWSDFTGGPRTNVRAREAQVGSLQEKGYLAFRMAASGKVELKTDYRALGPRYFMDFKEFRRRQDIPDRYFSRVSAAPAWFVSHRWEALNHPDPRGTQFRMLREFLQTQEVKAIWYDYSCLPQEPRTAGERALFKESVQNLNSLVMATDFISIMSDDYMTRAWCYYEWVVSELLCCGRHALIRREDTPADYDQLLADLVLEGRIPRLGVTRNDDMPSIQELLLAGVDMFKTLALSVTFSVLNSFGFDFGVGIASRFARKIDFRQLWIIWQVLAGSSYQSGIRLQHLLDQPRLEAVLRERHERFGTHARLYQELGALSKTPLDMRIIEQNSQNKLLALLTRVRQSGPIPAAYTTLALIKLVYTLAGTGDRGR